MSQYATLKGKRVAVIRRRFRLYGNQNSIHAGLKALKFPLAASNRHFNGCKEAVITVTDLPFYLCLSGQSEADSDATKLHKAAVMRCLQYMNFFIPKISIQLGDPERFTGYAKMYQGFIKLRKIKPSYEAMGFDKADHLQKVTAQRQRMGLWTI